MSCISSISASGERIAAAAACATPLPFSAPPVTHTKVRRLYDMSVSKDPKVRAIAAGHPNTPEDALWELCDDDNIYVRSWVTRNPNVNADILSYMMDEDLSPVVRAGARWRYYSFGNGKI